MLDEDLRELLALFAAHHVDFLVVGGHAVAFHGLFAYDFIADDRVIQLGRAPNRVDHLTRLWGVDVEEAWQRRVDGEIDRIPVSMLSRADLIRNKRATTRPRDLAPAAALEALGTAETTRGDH